jgi:hypothetical protein
MTMAVSLLAAFHHSLNAFASVLWNIPVLVKLAKFVPLWNFNFY